MNPFLFSIVALCLATTGAIAQYGSAPQYNSGYSQRKMSPSPQTYGNNNAAGYGGEQQSHYGQQEMSSYGEQPQSYSAPASYKAPSSAKVSTYDERTPVAASSYGSQQQSYGGQQQSYARPQQSSSYGSAAPAASYAKPAAKYEEPHHAPMPFAWGYDINDGYGGAQYHKESGDEYGKRTGSYGYTDAYGIYRQVDYVADEHGFRATIKTNEPGTANESPADVELHAYEPPSNYYAGNTNSYGSNNGYGQSGSYGKASKSSSYSAPAASSYGQQQQSSYGQQQRSSYGKQSSYQQAPARQSYHQQQEQQSYSSSAIVPVFTKAATGAAVAPKKY